jgi:DNA-binding beta-propeller fold protein YncE
LGANSTYLADQTGHGWEAGDSPAADFLRKLYSLDVDLVPHIEGAQTSDTPVIVLITRTGDTTDLVTRSRDYKEIVPVSFLHGASAAFPDLSQVIVSELGASQAAERVARIVRFGGRTMVEWNRLVQEASEWSEERSSGLLLPSERIPAALHLAQSDYAYASPQHRETVTRFLDAGLSAVAKRRRRGRTILSIAGTTLGVFIVLAAIQTVAALSAERRSAAEADRATASRLSSIAREYMNLDPDLPSILVNRAAELSDDPAVAGAVADVAASTIKHRSIVLPSVPRQVSAAKDTSLVAVSSMLDSSIMLLDGSTGQITGKLDYGTGEAYKPASIELSPDGAWLAVEATDSAPRLLATDEARGEVLAQNAMQEGDDFLAWSQASQGIISRSQELLAVDVMSGQTNKLWSFTEGESVRALTQSADGGFVAVAMTERVVLLRAETFEEVRSFPVADVTDVALSADGGALFGARFPYGIAIAVGKTPATDKTTETNLAAVSVEALEGGFFAVGDRRGGLSLHAGDRAEAAFEVRAHLTDSVRLARLANGDLASVGYDKYLRLWAVPAAAQLGNPTDLGYQPLDPSDTAGGTHQIRHLGGSSYGVVIAPSYIRLLVGDDHTADSQIGFAGLHTRSIISPDGRHLTMISTDRLKVFEFDRTLDKWSLNPVMDVSGEITNMISSGLDVVEVAVSSDGRAVLVTNAKGARVWRAGETRPSSSMNFKVASTPVAARFGGDGHAEVVTVDGIIHRLDGSGGELRESEGTSLTNMASAVFVDDKALLYVDDAGALIERREGINRELLPPGSATSSFGIRASLDGRYVAVLTSSRVIVVNRTIGRMVFERASVGPLHVADVAFSPAESDRMETISSLGTTGTVRFDSSTDIEVGKLTSSLTAPREVTATERHALSLDEVDPRG